MNLPSRLWLLTLFLEIGLCPTLADVVINEIVARNEMLLEDQDGDLADWIELYNTGPDAANLAGYFLTDEHANLERWEFDSVSIPSDGYLIVFASGKNRSDPGSELHSNFKLANEGEYVALIAPDGTTVIDEYAPAFPAIGADISYGLSPDREQRGVLASATPGAPNAPIAVLPEVLSFTAAPNIVPHGGEVTFQWETRNATRVAIESTVSDLAASGSHTEKAFRSGIYRLVASNNLGSASQELTVSVGPNLGSFSIRPETIVPGGSAILRWTALWGGTRMAQRWELW